MNEISRSRNFSIDLLKTISILFVVITHFAYPSDFRQKLLFPFYIDMAVPIFMIISGYNYYNSCESKNQNI